MRAIITKYAVTSGIKVVEGKLDSEQPMLSVGEAGNWIQYYHGADFHTTRATAKLDVIARFERKRRSLEKQLRKLDGKMRDALKQIDEADLNVGGGTNLPASAVSGTAHANL